MPPRSRRSFSPPSASLLTSPKRRPRRCPAAVWTTTKDSLHIDTAGGDLVPARCALAPELVRFPRVKSQSAKQTQLGADAHADSCPRRDRRERSVKRGQGGGDPRDRAHREEGPLLGHFVRVVQ